MATPSDRLCLAALALAACASAMAWAAPLTEAEMSVLRERDPRYAMPEPSARAQELAAKIGREANVDGFRALASLRSAPLLYRAAASYEAGAPKDRHVADLCAVLFAVRGAGDRWDVERGGRLDLRPDMTFEWRSEPEGRHAYLLKKAVDTAAVDRRIERELEQLLTN